MGSENEKLKKIEEEKNKIEESKQENEDNLETKNNLEEVIEKLIKELKNKNEIFE